MDLCTHTHAQTQARGTRRIYAYHHLKCVSFTTYFSFSQSFHLRRCSVLFCLFCFHSSWPSILTCVRIIHTLNTTTTTIRFAVTACNRTFKTDHFCPPTVLFVVLLTGYGIFIFLSRYHTVCHITSEPLKMTRKFNQLAG